MDILIAVKNRKLIIDGATGTPLQHESLKLIHTRPGIIQNIHRKHPDAITDRSKPTLSIPVISQ